MNQDSLQDSLQALGECHGTVHIHMVKFLLSLEEAHFIHAAHWSLPKGPVQIGWQGPVSSMGPLGPGIV